MSKSKKDFWTTDIKCEGYGYYADLTKLPIGTTFHVFNGNWYGAIVDHNGEKAIMVQEEVFKDEQYPIYPISGLSPEKVGLVIEWVHLGEE